MARPLRLFWYTPPWILSNGYPNRPSITLHRLLTMDRLARRYVEAMGASIIDASSITHAAWESTVDGVHYQSSNGADLNGRMSEVVYQATLNALFEECDGSDAAGPSDTALPPRDPLSPPDSTLRCGAPLWPFGVPLVSGKAWQTVLLSAEWGVLNIAATPLQHCVPATVTITADHVVEQWRGVDANSVGVEVQFVMWTRSDGSGQPCSSVDDCTRVVRRAPLRWVDDGASMEASLTPDPSVDHYVIVVTTRRTSKVTLERTALPCNPAFVFMGVGGDAG
jgi:hypothetical protein